MEKGRCTIWKEAGKINFNFFDSKTNSTKQLSYKDFYKLIEKEVLPHSKKIIINGGHFIPHLNNQEKVGKNSITTWKMACALAKEISEKGVETYVSLLINDISFSPNERKQLKLSLPKIFLKIANDSGVKTLYYSENPSQIYTEKKCANRFENQRRTKKWNLYEFKIENYCIQAIIFYLRDIKKQGADTSIWITPKCSSRNLIEAIKLFDEREGGIRNICYFETDNCCE